MHATLAPALLAAATLLNFWALCAGLVGRKYDTPTTRLLRATRFILTGVVLALITTVL